MKFGLMAWNVNDQYVCCRHELWRDRRKNPPRCLQNIVSLSVCKGLQTVDPEHKDLISSDCVFAVSVIFVSLLSFTWLITLLRHVYTKRHTKSLNSLLERTLGDVCLKTDHVY